MKFTKIFLFIAITGLLLNSCGGDDVSKIADMQCEMTKLRKEQKDATDDAKKDEIDKKIKELREEMKTLGDKIEKTLGDDKKADYEARIKMSKRLLDCSSMDEKDKERLNKRIERYQKKLKDLK